MRLGIPLGVFVAVGTVLTLASPAKAQTHTFTTDPDFDSGSLNNVVHLPSNQLQLGPTPVSKTTLVWVDNYVPGWIVRIDSSTGKQTARFDSALQFINGQPTGARPSKENCNWANAGNCPGRVAVDTNGDVWIVNRAFGAQGSLSKFSGNIGHCIDRNNNGVIDTSRDANNDGIVNPNDPLEYLGPNDECILTTIPVGGIGDCPRSVAVDKKGKIWVGTCCGGFKIYRYNPNEPVALEATIQMPSGSCMYSAASGGDYVFFSNRAAASTIRVNIDTLQVQNAPCGTETYGVVADPAGGWAWLGGYSQAYVRKANFTTNPPTCTSYPAPAMVTAVTLDLQGNVWASGYGNGQVYKYNPAGTLRAASRPALPTPTAFRSTSRATSGRYMMGLPTWSSSLRREPTLARSTSDRPLPATTTHRICTAITQACRSIGSPPTRASESGKAPTTAEPTPSRGRP